MTPSAPSKSTWPVRVLTALALLVVAVVAALYLSPFRLFQLNLVVGYACALVGLYLLTGLTGQISLGHGAFFAFGAYAMTLSAPHVGLLGGLVVTSVLALPLGYLVGVPAVRLSGLHLALVTLGLAVLTPPLIKRFPDLTGGVTGTRLELPDAPAWAILAADQWLFLASLTILAVVMTMVAAMSRRRSGRAMRALAQTELTATAMGVDVRRLKATAFALSVLLAAVGGALNAMTVGFVAPASFSVMFSVYLLAGLVLGGLRLLPGAVVGAVFLLYVPHLVQSVNDAAPGLVFGVAIIAVMLIAPAGIAGLGLKLRERLPLDVARLRTSRTSQHSHPLPEELS